MRTPRVHMLTEDGKRTMCGRLVTPTIVPTAGSWKGLTCFRCAERAPNGTWKAYIRAVRSKRRCS